MAGKRLGTQRVVDGTVLLGNLGSLLLREAIDHREGLGEGRPHNASEVSHVLVAQAVFAEDGASRGDDARNGV
jgi:hypothetical protein